MLNFFGERKKFSYRKNNEKILDHGNDFSSRICIGTLRESSRSRDKFQNEILRSLRKYEKRKNEKRRLYQIFGGPPIKKRQRAPTSLDFSSSKEIQKKRVKVNEPIREELRSKLIKNGIVLDTKMTRSMSSRDYLPTYRGLMIKKSLKERIGK